MQEEKVTKKRGITEEDKEEFSHMTETDGLVRFEQMRKGCFFVLFRDQFDQWIHLLHFIARVHSVCVVGI